MFFNLTFSADERILLIDDSPALSGLGSLYGCLFFFTLLQGGSREATHYCLCSWIQFLLWSHARYTIQVAEHGEVFREVASGRRHPADMVFHGIG